MRRTGVLAYLRMTEDDDESEDRGDGGGGGRSSSTWFGWGAVGALRVGRGAGGVTAARCANSGMGLEGRRGEGDFVFVCCVRCGDFSMGHTSRPLLRTYSCHLGSLRSGGATAAAAAGKDKDVRCRAGDFGRLLPWASLESRLEESVEARGEPVDTVDSGRRFESLRSLLRGLGAWQSSAGDMLAEGGIPREFIIFAVYMRMIDGGYRRGDLLAGEEADLWDVGADIAILYYSRLYEAHDCMTTKIWGILSRAVGVQKERNNRGKWGRHRGCSTRSRR